MFGVYQRLRTWILHLKTVLIHHLFCCLWSNVVLLKASELRNQQDHGINLRNNLGKVTNSQTQLPHVWNGLKFSPRKIVVRIQYQQDEIYMQGLALQCPIKMCFPSLWIDTTETAPDNAESVLSMYRLRFNSKKKNYR